MNAAYEQEMNAGRASLTARQWTDAYQHFGRAHNLGHDILRCHLAAHRGMIVAAFRGGRVDRAAQNIVLLAMAWIFDKDARPATS